jgi:hypothetical protein
MYEEDGVPDDEASAWDDDSSPALNEDDDSTEAIRDEEEGVPDDEASAWDDDSSGRGSLTTIPALSAISTEAPGTSFLRANEEEEGVRDDEASAWDDDSSGGTPALNGDDSTQAHRDEEGEGGNRLWVFKKSV